MLIVASGQCKVCGARRQVVFRGPLTEHDALQQLQAAPVRYCSAAHYDAESTLAETYEWDLSNVRDGKEHTPIMYVPPRFQDVVSPRARRHAMNTRSTGQGPKRAEEIR